MKLLSPFYRGGIPGRTRDLPCHPGSKLENQDMNLNSLTPYFLKRERQENFEIAKKY